MYVGAGLTVISLVIGFATRSMLVNAIAEANPSLNRVSIERHVDRELMRDVVRTIVGVGLWLWMAVKNADGRRWARGVATLLAALNVGLTLFVLLLFGLAGLGAMLSFAPIHVVLAGVGVLLAAVIVAYLFTQESSDYYDLMTRWHAAVTLRGY
jgi:hypothetical protein